ncbi:hypothetical protein [Paludisphaera soli]|uniref:hypothetical protein n=1 Tax=Paludisphaera soli TaxID=2712865 RepID=UPI0013EA2E3B|nr:hypothetical protein [Paludisphaera soli]
MARTKSHAGKLNVRLPRGLNTEFRTWIQEVADRHTYFGRRLGVEPCVGALVESFLSMTSAEREEVLSKWLPRLEVRERAEHQPADDIVPEVSLEEASDADQAIQDAQPAMPRSTVTRYSREFPDPPEDAGQGLHGDDAPARKPRKAPARKRGS